MPPSTSLHVQLKRRQCTSVGNPPSITAPSSRSASQVHHWTSSVTCRMGPCSPLYAHIVGYCTPFPVALSAFLSFACSMPVCLGQCQDALHVERNSKLVAAQVAQVVLSLHPAHCKLGPAVGKPFRQGTLVHQRVRVEQFN